eukprot:1161348-Pelagomonas_calceolata.AAC.10
MEEQKLQRRCAQCHQRQHRGNTPAVPVVACAEPQGGGRDTRGNVEVQLAYGAVVQDGGVAAERVRA